MKEQMMKIIEAQNRMVETLEKTNAKVNIFDGMQVWHILACEGSEITHAARECGIDAKVNMQTGKITVYGEL